MFEIGTQSTFLEEGAVIVGLERKVLQREWQGITWSIEFDNVTFYFQNKKLIHKISGTQERKKIMNQDARDEKKKASQHQTARDTNILFS